MKLYKLAFYILIFSAIWISCGGDDTPPVVEIISPEENSSFTRSDVLVLEARVTDNDELDFVAIAITGPDGSTNFRKIEADGTSHTLSESFDLEFEQSGNILLVINTVDKNENNVQIERTYQYNNTPVGQLNINFKLQYNGEPLVMFTPYAYPDGKKIDFTRCSFYLSELKLDETIVEDIEFHNLTNSHSNLTLAEKGYSWKIESIPTGNYTSLSFNIGVPEELNNQDPGDFPSGHPLAKPSENWFSWMSYIFLKVEGNVDLTGDGEADTSLALHTGSNEALRKITLDYPIAVVDGEETEITLIFDLYQLFDGAERIFPIEETNQIHSLDQLDAVLELSNNLTNAINK